MAKKREKTEFQKRRSMMAKVDNELRARDQAAKNGRVNKK